MSTKKSHGLLPTNHRVGIVQQRAPQNTQINTQIGHNGERVLILHSRSLVDYQLTEEEAEMHIKAVQGALDELRKFKSGRVAVTEFAAVSADQINNLKVPGNG